jgi:hypothetical protein
LGRHIVRRLARRAGWVSPGAGSTQSDGAWRHQLWRDEAVSSLLDARNMLSNELLNPVRLQAFFERSHE